MKYNFIFMLIVFKGLYEIMLHEMPKSKKKFNYTS